MKRNIAMTLILMFGFIFSFGLMAQGSKKANETMITQVTAKEKENQGNTLSGQGKNKEEGKKRIVKEDKILKFINEKGEVIKQIDLSEKREKIRVGKEIREKRNWKLAAVSKNGEYGVIIENEDNPKELKASKIKMINNEGNVIWEREMEKGRTASLDTEAQPDVQCANNGNIAIYTSLYEGEEGKITLYNKEGEIIMELPTEELLKKYLYCIPGGEFKLSPDGKYIGVEFSIPAPKARTLIFFNIRTGKSYELEKNYAILKIDNDGKARIMSGDEYKTINLKEILGE